MIPARTPGAMLAEVHRRARQYRRRQAMVVAGGVVAVLLLVVVAVRVLGGDDGGGGGDDGTTEETAAALALEVEFPDVSGTGLPAGFVPRAVAAGPDGFVMAGAAPGGTEPVWRSGDGSTWEVAGAETFASAAAASLAATPARYLMGVTDTAGASPRFLQSDDGQTWTLATQLATGDDLVSLRAAGDRFYRLSGTGLITSTDGVDWTPTATEGGTSLPAGTLIEAVGDEWVAEAIGTGGGITAAWRSADGITFTPATAPNVAPVGIAGGADRVVLARAAAPPAGCSPPPSGEAPGSTATPVCEYPIGFAVYDPATGATTENPQPAFASAVTSVAIEPIGDGWMAVQVTAAGSALLWSSGDGLTWVQASPSGLGVAPGGPVVAAAAGGRAVVVSDTAGADQPPGVAVVNA